MSAGPACDPSPALPQPAADHQYPVQAGAGAEPGRAALDPPPGTVRRLAVEPQPQRDPPDALQCAAAPSLGPVRAWGVQGAGGPPGVGERRPENMPVSPQDAADAEGAGGLLARGQGQGQGLPAPALPRGRLPLQGMGAWSGGPRPGGSASRDWQRAWRDCSPRKGHCPLSGPHLRAELSTQCLLSPRFCGGRFLLCDGWGDWNCGQSDVTQATQPCLRSPAGPPRLTLLSRGGRRGGETTASGRACSGQTWPHGALAAAVVCVE